MHHKTFTPLSLMSYSNLRQHTHSNNAPPMCPHTSSLGWPPSLCCDGCTPVGVVSMLVSRDPSTTTPFRQSVHEMMANERRLISCCSTYTRTRTHACMHTHKQTNKQLKLKYNDTYQWQAQEKNVVKSGNTGALSQHSPNSGPSTNPSPKL